MSDTADEATVAREAATDLRRNIWELNQKQKVTLTKETWYRVNVRRAGPGSAQLEVTVPAKAVKELGLKRGDTVHVAFSREET